MSLLPFDALVEVAQVLHYGKMKYDRDNWRSSGFDYCRLEAAMLRHYTAWANGEDFDPESNLHHLAHMAFSVLVLLQQVTEGKGKDTRHQYGHSVDFSYRGKVPENVMSKCVPALPHTVQECETMLPSIHDPTQKQQPEDLF